jgi:hypothetical protein
MPQRMDRFHRRRQDVLHELSGRARQMLLRHDFIVSKSQLVPVCTRLYNQVNICSDGLRNRWPCSCITRLGILPSWVGSVKGANVEERLKSLMQDLGNAINDSLSDSERIAEAIGEIKRSGYDVFLVLEATIGFNKRDEDDDPSDEEMTDEPQEVGTTGKARFTTQDQRFLKALRITVDEES